MDYDMIKITKQELEKILMHYPLTCDLMRIREYLYKNRKDFIEDILKHTTKEIETAMKNANGWDFKIKD